jgi:hypothetical protein
MRRLGWWTGQHAGQFGLGRRLKRVLGRNVELGRGVQKSKVEKTNKLFEAVQDVREHEIEKREGSNELNLLLNVDGWACVMRTPRLAIPAIQSLQVIRSGMCG